MNDLAPVPPPLTRWEYAGLMVTYWCNAKCAFCYVYSAPDRGGKMSPADAVAFWRGLQQHAAGESRTMKIHLAGGEPFGDWPQLLSIVRAAHEAGLPPLEKIETNAFWASDENLVRARLEQLDAFGMNMLHISADAYHQEFIPLDRVVRLLSMARRVLGGRRVRVRWWDTLLRPVDVRGRAVHEKQSIFALATAKHADRIAGRAADRLAPLLPRYPAEHFRNRRCESEILQSRHVHVDAFGNVFPGVCAGIILGNLHEQPADVLWERLSRAWPSNPVLEAVVRGGSYALMQRAIEVGYIPRVDGYASKCHLCSDARQFLFEAGIWPHAIGPADCYANARDHSETAAWREAIERRRVSLPVIQ
ncbi:MAG: radical SAM protein [Phycisphaerales bacterium]|nr:radical SAM protein [Phycisphaerales bacterium]